MTLPEVLIVISIMGILVSVVAAAITVSFRTVTNAEGRVNVARAEQSIDTWLPADLTSTDVNDTTLPAVDTNPAATPCGNCGSLDLSGANALQLAWKTTVPGSPPTTVITRVQYQYIQVGPEWQIQRIECVGGNPCKKYVVLHDVTPPPDPATYDPDAVRPVWVMDVAAPSDPAALALSDNARRVVVTIDGGGDSAGAGGGANSVSLTAGGAVTGQIAADEFTVPSFVRARSRCGGPVTLIVDDSGSIGGAVNTVVKPGVRAFIEAFRGTPTQIQVVKFSNQASVVGSSNWHHYVDMTNDAAVDALKNAVGPALVANGGTNWEEAFFHTLKDANGNPAPILPNRIVFFTDGVPTVNRAWDPNPWGLDFSNGPVVHYNAGRYRTPTAGSWPVSNGSAFHQESWDRADVILDGYRGIDLIFVGVGPGLDQNGNWIHNPAVYADLSANPAPAVTKTGAQTLAYLLANAPSGEVNAIYDPANQVYTNPETADFYKISTFDPAAFGAAMKAAALKDCGGTLTIQTRLTSGAAVADEFIYENVEYRDSSGTPVAADPRRVTTSATFRTGTFDFEIPASSTHFSVDVVPQELATLAGYNFAGWSCRAGATPKTAADMVPIPIANSTFQGVTVTVKANEAVSCIMQVTT